MRRTATPLLVTTNPKSVNLLERCDLKRRDGSSYDERFVQELVHESPAVLPIAEIEPAFSPLVPVCTELPLASGYLDNLLVTPRGDLVAVECKLWRNSEARREVIAQVIDYAKDLQSLNYEGLEAAIRHARCDVGFGLYAHVASQCDEGDVLLDEAQFVDTVSRNLKRGRCLLAVVGDGITEGVEGLTEFLQQHAGLHFALVLVELAIHKLPGSSDLVVIPSIPLRTTNIVRGIVQMQDGRVSILPPPPTTRAEKPTTLTEDEFFAGLDAHMPGTSDRLVAFLASCEDLQVSWGIRRKLAVRVAVGDHWVVPFVIGSDGNADFAYMPGLKSLTTGFMQVIVDLVPGSVLTETATTLFAKKAGGGFITVWELLEHAAGVRSALEELNQALHENEASSNE